MCTALCSRGTENLFGRTLDFEHSYGEKIVITPRRHQLVFRHLDPLENHFSLIGVAIVRAETPLYFDAMNEAGLCAAALRFADSAVYFDPSLSATNVASFELMPYVLSQCKTVSEVVGLLHNVNITNDSFEADLPAAPLHWIFADSSKTIVVESVVSGVKIYENAFHVLTNEPPFPYHKKHMEDFLHLSAYPHKNTLCPSLEIAHSSRGSGGLGLPGDFTSASRFVRALFLEKHTSHGSSSKEEISRFFHIMNNVSAPQGAVKTEDGKDVFTAYTSCADMATKTYCFTTHNCRRIRAVRLTDVSADADSIIKYAMETEEDIQLQ